MLTNGTPEVSGSVVAESGSMVVPGFPTSTDIGQVSC